MPLSFQSLSHGEVAFGFFNIETDMMLLNQYFFFARDFSDLVGSLAGKPSGPLTGELQTHVLKAEDRGSLMWAIEGIDYRGFIGETYRLYPFPKDPAAFKQNPEGDRTRHVMEERIARYAARTTIIPVTGQATGDSASIGEYLFDRQWFQELIRYVWMGGYPRWKDGVMPGYVVKMKEEVERSQHPLFAMSAK
jgi:hypothetical protein